MPDPTWTAVDRYLEHALLRDEPALAQALASSEQAGLPDIMVSPPQGKFLRLLAQIAGAKRILEIGTLGGYSTLWLAGAVGEDGKIVTLEYETKHAEVARRNFEHAGVGDRIDLRLGKAAESLEAMIEQGTEPFDLVFIDADKESSALYVQLSIELTRPGSILVIDNVIRRGRVADESEQSGDVVGMRDTLELIGRHSRLDAVALQTVGGKSYDGLCIARVSK